MICTICIWNIIFYVVYYVNITANLNDLQYKHYYFQLVI